MLRLLAVLGARRPGGLFGGATLLPALGIALGVALGYGVHLVNRAAVGELEASVRELAGEADLVVTGGRAGFPEKLYPEVSRVPGVAWAKPGLELEAGIAGTERSLRVRGVDAVREHRPALLDPDTVLAGPAAAQEVRDGELRLMSGGLPVPLKVAGEASIKGRVVLADVSTVQWRFGRVGELNRLDVRLARGADPAEVRRRIAGLLPPGAHVSTVDEQAGASAYPSRAYRVNMNVLAMIALFTGGFLVFSAQALEAARRRGEHALLRVLGLQRGGLARLVLLEAGVLGAVGGALGLVLGYALAVVASRTVGADLGGGAFGGASVPRLDVSAGAAFLYLLAGIGIAVAGALLPALDAARVPPARALKAGDEQAVLLRVSPAWPGVLLLAAGAALAWLPPVQGLPLFGYASIACLLLGAVALMPRASQALLAAVPGLRSVPFALAVAQLRGAPGHAAVSLAAIVASFALMAAMAIMVSSFRQSVDDWLAAVLPADLYVRVAHSGDAAFLEPAFESGVRGLPQVARADFLRTGRIVLDPARPSLGLIARDRAERAFPLVGARHEPRADDPPSVWVSEAVADLHGFGVSKKISIPLGGRLQELVVSGVFRDYARQHGALLVDRADYIALTGDRRVNDAALWLAPGATAAAAMDALRKLSTAELEMAVPGEIREVSLRIFDRSFAATYAVEAVAMLVGLFGLSSSLGAIVLARRREFGVLRHLGVTRGQVRAMLAAEGGLLAALGALGGLAAGAAISLVLVFVVNRQSFHWSMELHPPYLFLGALTLVLVALSVVTAMLAGRQATGMGPVRAVKEDW